MITIVHLVRHGEVHNPDKILYGRLPDYHLSERGQRMAKASAAKMEGHDVTVLQASPLLRAQQTAQEFAKVTGLEIETNEDLLEAGNRLEGLRIRGWRSQLWNPVRWPLLRNPLIPSWGEPYEDIVARMLEAVEKARRAAYGHEAVLVSHQLPIVCVQRFVQGKSLAHNPAARQCDLVSISSLVFDEDDLVDFRYCAPGDV